MACPALAVAPVASSEAFRREWQAGRKVLDPLPILASLGAPAQGSEPVREWAWARPAAQLEEHLADFAGAAKEPQSACSSARTATSCSEEANAFYDSTYPPPASFSCENVPSHRLRSRSAQAMRRRECAQATGGARAEKNVGGEAIQPNFTAASGRHRPRASSSGMDGGSAKATAPAKCMTAQIAQ